MAENEMIICRCEEVTYGELVETADKYGCSPRELKLRTRAGMGYCGGRTCRNAVDSIAHSSTKRDVSQITLKYQPPIRPISFSKLGGVGNND
ncbi:(2Fe-2S)-binding protein [Sporosarcina luteola]|uniref:(2Fe-2S)-binding protein n=1 Tax=Sporosarcina luteola TaxID=582850 RepID=UPI0020425806|nr:(2Fe-2S)-binding protein [Sporosarcina luteola]MCM3745036.1 (2Fe-2S)-binding protein [Sporosarcina luteola]